MRALLLTCQKMAHRVHRRREPFTSSGKQPDSSAPKPFEAGKWVSTGALSTSSNAPRKRNLPCDSPVPSNGYSVFEISATQVDDGLGRCAAAPVAAVIAVGVITETQDLEVLIEGVSVAIQADVREDRIGDRQSSLPHHFSAMPRFCRSRSSNSALWLPNRSGLLERLDDLLDETATCSGCQATRQTDPLTTRGIGPLRGRSAKWKTLSSTLPRPTGPKGGGRCRCPWTFMRYASRHRQAGLSPAQAMPEIPENGAPHLRQSLSGQEKGRPQAP